MRGTVALSLALLLGGWSAPAARAGSITAGSIWNQANAAMRARSQLPAGARITDTRCVTVQVRNDNHYRCTVRYTKEPAAPQS